VPSLHKIKKIKELFAIVVLILFTLSLLNSGKSFNNPIYKTESFSGDLILSGNQVYEICDKTFEIDGSIVITENATLLVRNATLKIVNPAIHNITLQKPKNGNPRLTLINSTLTSTSVFEVHLLQNATMSTYGSTIELAEFYLKDKSILRIEKSKVKSRFSLEKKATLLAKLTTFDQVPRKIIPNIYCYDRSRVELTSCESKISSWFRIYDNSIAIIKGKKTKFGIQAFNSANVTIMGGEHFKVEFYDESRGSIRKVELIERVFIYDQARVEIISTEVFGMMRMFNNSALELYDSTIWLCFSAEREDELGSGLVMFSNSKAIMRDSEIQKGQLYDHSTLILFDTKTENLSAYDNAVLIISGKMDKLSCVTKGNSILNIIDAESAKNAIESHDVSQIFVKRSVLGQGITISDSSKVYIMDSELNWLSIKNEGQLFIEKSLIKFFINLEGKAEVITDELQAQIINLGDHSKALIQNSLVSTLRLYDDSSCRVTDSEIEGISIFLHSAEVSLESLKPSQYDKLEIPHLMLQKVKVIEGWNIAISGQSKVQLTDCEIISLELKDNSNVTLLGTTAAYRRIEGSSVLYIYCRLEVKAKLNTTITVKDRYGNEVARETITDKKTKKAKIYLLAEVVNASSTITKIDEYTVIVERDGWRDEKIIQPTSNIMLDYIRPSQWMTDWYFYIAVTIIILTIIILATLILKGKIIIKRSKT